MRLSLKLLLLSLTVSSACALDGIAIEPPKGARALVALREGSRPALEFVVHNEGRDQLRWYPLRYNNNHIFLLSPAGGVLHEHAIAEDLGGRAVRMIESGGRASETVILDDLLEWRGLEQPGVYRLFWEIEGTRSNEVCLLRHHARVPDQFNLRPRAKEDPVYGDLTTPKAAIRTLLRMVDGNHQDLWRILPREVTGTVEGSTVLLQSLSIATRTFKERAEQRFGKSAVAGWALESKPDVQRAIDAASVSVTEHFREALVCHSEWRIRFVREEDLWRLAPSNMTTAARDQLARRVGALEAAVKDLDAARSWDNALRALNSRLAGIPSFLSLLSNSPMPARTSSSVLNVVYSADAQIPMIELWATNDSDHPIQKHPFGSSENHVIVSAPDGKSAIVPKLEDRPNRVKEMISPGDTAVWRARLGDLVPKPFLATEGECRAKWNFPGTKSLEFFIVTKQLSDAKRAD